MVCALLFTSFLLVYPKEVSNASSAQYSTLLFDNTKVSDIKINISDDDWQDMLSNPLKEEYHKADITINGETFYNVGIRTKGNTSLSQVASSDSERYSFKVKFDKYVTGQSYYGLDMLNLNNIYADATYLKEYLSYDLFEFMDVTTPENSFSNITINDNNYGLYLAIEGLQESYLERNYGYDHGNLYKAEGTGTNLKYTGETQSNYSGIKDNAVTAVTDDDFQKIIDMIRNLNNGTNLEKYIDIDATLRYFAVSTALVNLDSYQSNLFHNYYIYEKDGICTILPWDLNLSFGGFSAEMGGRNKGEMNNSKRTSNDLSTIHFPIDEPTSTNLSDSPLLEKLLEVDEYKELYHKYLNDIVSTYFDSGIFKNKLYSTASLIDEYVKNDSTAFYSYSQFKNSLDELYKLGNYRSKSISLQLTGVIPSTKEAQNQVNLDEYLGSNLVNMSLLGSMGGGKGDENKVNAMNQNTDSNISSNIPPQINNATNGNMNPPDMDINQGGINGNIPSPNNNNQNGMTAPPIDNDMMMQQTESSNNKLPNPEDNQQQIPVPNDKTKPAMGNMDKNNLNSNKSISTLEMAFVLSSIVVISIACILANKFKRKKYMV
ncbi:CotH kinase family protein [Clostridium paraputrificum]|uniref:CotH kinase family protein n=1 Tax=Clostridium paraputrificum TaxID=29363 RepID=UPI001897A908|nr:CotH kinase family protein [Clostridium paraputrificum]